MKEASPKYNWHNHQLAEHQIEGKHFMLVNKQIIKYLHEKYGISEGHYSEFKRIARKQGDGEVVVELRFRKLRIMAFPSVKFRRNDPWFIYAPRSDTVGDLKTKIRRLLRSYYYNDREDRSMRMLQFRLWKSRTDDET